MLVMWARPQHRREDYIARSGLETKFPPGGGAAMEEKWEVASRTWGRRVRAKVLQAGKEAKDLQTELTPTGLGWALRELRSDSFFNLFFSSRGNLS